MYKCLKTLKAPKQAIIVYYKIRAFDLVKTNYVTYYIIHLSKKVQRPILYKKTTYPNQFF